MKIKKKRFTMKIKLLIMLVLTVVLAVPLFTNVVYAEVQNKNIVPFNVQIVNNELTGFHTIDTTDFDYIVSQTQLRFYITENHEPLDINTSNYYYFNKTTTSITIRFNNIYDDRNDYLVLNRDGSAWFDEYTYPFYFDIDGIFLFDFSQAEEEVEYTNSSNNSIEFVRSYDNTTRPSPRTILRNFYIDKYKSNYNYINGFFVSYLRHIQASPSITIPNFNIHYYGYMRVDRGESLNILSEVTNSTPDGTAMAERETLTFEVYKGIPLSFGFYNTVTDEYFKNVDDVTNIRLIITFNHGNMILNNSYNIGIKYEVIHLNNTTTTIHMSAIIGTYNGSTDTNTWNDTIQSTNANGNINNLRLTYTQLDGYSTGFQAGKQEGRAEGKQEGLNEGYNDGRDYYGILYQGNWISASQYGDIRYQVGLQENDYNAIWDEGYRAGADDTFYNGMKEWIVPAIIVVILLGGFVTIIQKRKNGDN